MDLPIGFGPDTEEPYLSRRQNWITQLHRHALMQPAGTALRFEGRTITWTGLAGRVASLAGASYIYAPALGVWLYGHSTWLGFGLIIVLCAAVLLHGWKGLQDDRELTRS